MHIYEAPLTEALLARLIDLSADWEAENSTYGYRKNGPGDIEGNRIFLAEREGEVVGYLLGHAEQAEGSRSIMADGTWFFEVEELYVVPVLRSQGVGRRLFRYAEDRARESGCALLMLSTATKNYRSILHFYLDELGMEFWSARLFKRLGPDR